MHVDQPIHKNSPHALIDISLLLHVLTTCNSGAFHLPHVFLDFLSIFAAQFDVFDGVLVEFGQERKDLFFKARVENLNFLI